MREIKLWLWSCVLLTAILVAGPLEAQESRISRSESFDLKKLSGIPFQYYPDPLDWVILSEDSSLLFVGDWDDDEDDYYLWCIELDAGGNIVQYSLIDYQQKAFVLGARAFWIHHGDAPENDHGLFFSSFVIPENVLGRSQIKYFVRRFDARGTLYGNPEVLLDIELPDGRSPNGVWLGANIREGGIGLAMSFGIYEYSESFMGYWGSDAYFLEYLPAGFVSQAGVNRIAQQNSGKSRMLHLYEPVWNGAGWVIPAVETKIKRLTQYGTKTGRRWKHKLMTVVATPHASGASISFKKRTLERDNTRYDIPYKDPFFLPPHPDLLEPGSHSTLQNGRDLFLIYTKAFLKENFDDREQEATDYEYYQRTVNLNGKNVGSRVPLEVPDWERKFPNKPNWYVPEDFSFFSRPRLAGEGRYLIAFSRGAYFLNSTNWSLYRAEIQLDLNVYDPFSHVFERIATKNSKGKCLTSPPLLHTFGGLPCVIHSLSKLKQNSYSLDIYFSRFY